MTPLKLFCATVLASNALFAGEALAQETVTAAEARAIFEVWQKQPVSTEFDRWVSDQLVHYAGHCGNLAGVEAPRALLRARLFRAGTWTLPRDSAQSKAACSALAAANAEGLSPVCDNATSRQDPFAMPRNGLPSNYVFVQGRVKDGQTVLAGGYCWLMDGEPALRQFYVGPAVVRLLTEPTETVLRTATGQVSVKTSSVRFEVDGAPSPAPAQLAIWP